MFDVAIVGGGVSGCSLLYQLSKYNLKVVLLEKENDVGVGTTKANSAIVHAGYDPEPGTLMARYNVRGNAMVHALCEELDILFKNTGSLVLGFTEADKDVVECLYQNALQNGVPGVRIVQQPELGQMEPNVSPEAKFALYAPSAGVVNPWELAIAQAEVAVQNGAEVRLCTEVLGMQKQNGGFVLQTTKGDVEARFVVNAAGVFADKVSRMAGDDSFEIHPNKGEYYLLDKAQGEKVRHVLFQCPTDLGKGVLVAPTVHGNLIVGPDSEPSAATDTSTTTKGLAYVRQHALKSVPDIDLRQNIRNFAGVRAYSNLPDFVVGPSKTTPGLFHTAGIKSPGLTAAPAIAEDMVKMLEAAGLALTPKENYNNRRYILRFNHLTGPQKQEAIMQNPLYGKIVCRCETVTEGEIVDTLHRPLAPHSVDGVKRRCTTGMGRCQGGFCGPRVQAIIARELGVPQQEVPQDGEGSVIITGETKQPKGGAKA